MSKEPDYFLLLAVVLFMSGMIMFVFLYDKQKTENQELQDIIDDNSIIYSYYYLKDGIHKTTYFTQNNSYTIHKPFSCEDGILYGDFHTYIENCGEPN